MERFKYTYFSCSFSYLFAYSDHSLTNCTNRSVQPDLAMKEANKSMLNSEIRGLVIALKFDLILPYFMASKSN